MTLPKLSYFVEHSNAGEVIDKQWWNEGTELLYTCAREPLASNFDNFPDEKRTTERDLLLTRNGTPYVHIPVAGAIYSNVVQRVTLRPGLHRKYFLYALQDSGDRMRGYGVSIESLNYDLWASLKLTVPDFNIQERIANFLDDRTARIDALIADKELLVKRIDELSNSKLAYEIGGANKASNRTHYEWYPMVPDNWRVMPFKHAVQFIEGPGILATDFHDKGIPLLRVSSVRSAIATLDGCNYLDPAKVDNTWSHFRVKRGDLLISASASMGTVSLVTEETEGAVPYTGIIILRPLEGISNREFIRNFVVSDQFMRQIDIMKAGATIQHFGPTHLSRVVMALPYSLEEQAEIARRLNNSRIQHESLKQHVVEHIDRLLEYRSSLISAAVTGQIDVSNYKEVAAS